MRSRKIALALIPLVLTLGTSYLDRARCASDTTSATPDACGPTDILHLYRVQGIDVGRLPFLEPCPSEELCDEYPVVQMWLLRAAGALSHSAHSYFEVSAAMLALAALIATVALAVLADRRALFLSAAPSVVAYAFLDGDFYGIAFMMLAFLAYFRRRDVSAGLLIGLGAATKLFPAILLLPFVFDRLHSDEARRAAQIAVGAAVAWILINAPVAALSWDQWSVFFVFNANRPPEWTTLWYIGCRSAVPNSCLPVSVINAASATLFLAGFGLVWLHRLRAEPGFDRWTLVFPAFALFLLTTKVYSPQYSLWLLPLFALAFPRVKYFAAFTLTDVLVYALLWPWFSTNRAPGILMDAYQLVALLRAGVLLSCIIAWARGHINDDSAAATSQLVATSDTA